MVSAALAIALPAAAVFAALLASTSRALGYGAELVRALDLVGLSLLPGALSQLGDDHAVVIRAGVSTSPGNGTLTVKLFEDGNEVSTLIAAAQVGDYDDLGRTVYIATFSIDG